MIKHTIRYCDCWLTGSAETGVENGDIGRTFAVVGFEMTRTTVWQTITAAHLYRSEIHK